MLQKSALTSARSCNFTNKRNNKNEQLINLFFRLNYNEWCWERWRKRI